MSEETKQARHLPASRPHRQHRPLSDNQKAIPMKLSDVRQVTLSYIEGSPASFLIPASDVDRFVQASKRLHWKPGVNPHNGVKAAQVWKITVAELECRGPFWWTVPDLQNNYDPAGARIIDGGRERIVFIDEETTARWDAEQAEAEAAHHRERERLAREAAE